MTETPDLKLEEVVALEPDALSDYQKSFLETQKDNLTEEQASKFGIEVEAKIPDPEARFTTPEPKKDKKEEEDVDENEDVVVDDDTKVILAKQKASIKERI